ncbi:hypothetical protein Ade02nite_65920 [Paractinoplanes deccanensis]|uniref:Uncharacterized protein n=1 Tax=Paractinoplanes deccanensis TaxID=113561 RepID=A0ABQ3YD95_9ACTN|nr:hypothetical protein [Actinoplanes deccanensis]GID77951.1 hypothetical protein Ade02nite_65920 [Actinoplanes deccanensis]
MDTGYPAEWAGWRNEAARLQNRAPLRRSEWAARGPEDPKFALGDLLSRVPESWIDRLAEAVDAEPARFRLLREVAVKVPPERRVKASWTVHRDLRERPELLRDGLTSREAAVAAGRRAFDSKADQRLSAEERAAKVRDFLADPEVYRLVERELDRSRADRKVRYGARLVHEELARQEKDAKAELRARREAQSPIEATLKARISVLRSAQLVHAMAEISDDLPEHDRLVDALETLREQIDAALGRLGSTGEERIIDGETWHDRTTRAAIAGSG